MFCAFDVDFMRDGLGDRWIGDHGCCVDDDVRFELLEEVCGRGGVCDVADVIFYSWIVVLIRRADV